VLSKCYLDTAAQQWFTVRSGVLTSISCRCCGPLPDKTHLYPSQLHCGLHPGSVIQQWLTIFSSK